MPGLLDEMRAAEQAQQRGLLSHYPSNRPTMNRVGRGMADSLQGLGLLTAPIPVLGDAVGLLGDAAMYAAKPEERTWGNAGMTLLGALPFVPSVAGKLGKASRAENEAAGLYHPIGGGLKLERPVSDMTATRVPIAELPSRSIISPEAMQGGVLIPAVGDRTAAGSMLTAINGQALNSPVKLEGGADFMRTHLQDGAAWASGKGVVTRLSNQVKDAASGGKPVYMPYTAMGHTAGDFSTMMSDAVIGQINLSKIPKGAIKSFDKEMRALRPEFVGLADPKLREQLLSSGPVRLALIDRMNQAKFREQGFPDIASTRNAITEPGLLDAPLHGAGYSVAKMDPDGRVIRQPANPHTTYDTQLGGRYIGGLETNVPRDVMFPDYFKTRRAEGRPVEGDTRSFSLANVTQNADQQWLDGVMRYIERTRR